MNMNVRSQPDALPTAIITVAYVNPSPGPRKSGSIKDTDGRYFSAWPDKLKGFEPGETYEIAYTEKGQYRDIVAHKHIPAENIEVRQPAQRPQRAIDAQSILLNEGPHNGSRTENLQGTRAPVQQIEPQSVKASQSEHIFVCGGLYRDIEANRVATDEDALVDRAVLWRNVYRRTFGE
jgi:hypothetical protein